jgi:hypothetical protein
MYCVCFSSQNQLPKQSKIWSRITWLLRALTNVGKILSYLWKSLSSFSIKHTHKFSLTHTYTHTHTHTHIHIHSHALKFTLFQWPRVLQVAWTKKRENWPKLFPRFAVRVGRIFFFPVSSRRLPLVVVVVSFQV